MERGDKYMGKLVSPWEERKRKTNKETEGQSKERPGVEGLKEAAMKDQGTVSLRPFKEYSF